MLRTGSRRVYALAALVVGLAMTWTPARAGSVTPCAGDEHWSEIKPWDEFRTQGLPRSQGVTSDGDGWIFSWQGGLERTDDQYTEHAVATWPPDVALQPSYPGDGTNHVGGNHIGDVDVADGIVYAPFEDGGQDAGVITLNDPEYQRPYIALYEAKTLLYKKSFALPLDKHAAGVPWVAVNAPKNELYTAEWDMPHDRINVFDIPKTDDATITFNHYIPLTYAPELGSAFHLSRIQGAKVFGGALYASRDDAGKSVFKIDLATGAVKKLFSLDPGVPAELEGIAIRPTPDGALLHLLIVVHNKIDQSGDFKDIAVQFRHYALTCA